MRDIRMALKIILWWWVKAGRACGCLVILLLVCLNLWIDRQELCLWSILMYIVGGKTEL